MTAVDSTGRDRHATSATGPRRAGTPAVSGQPLRFLRGEGLVLFAASLAVFFGGLDEAWWLVPVLLFLPDVAIIGYLRSSRAGALAYNLAHSSPAPALVGGLALLSDSAVGQGVALIWFAHIGMDRALGYGLKYDSTFNDTHLGRIPDKADRENGAAPSEDTATASLPAPSPSTQAT
ncbi:MAG: hypothetical protein JWN57_255 [Frankiales bacterium]|nr:hypothetical protein [Frankiales bacterium]